MINGKPKNENVVLVVDDEPHICDIISQVLEQEGYQARICTHPESAIEAIGRESFPLAFIDINMPGMNGLEVAARVKEKDRACEIIMMSGFASVENAIQAIQVGASDYLRKPFSTSEISFCLKRFAERKGLRERAREAEERYHRLVQNIPTLIFRMRSDLHLDFVNDACLNMTGYDPDEAMKSRGWLLNCVHPDERKGIRELLESVFQSRRTSFSAECRLIHKEDHVIHGLMRCISGFDRRRQNPEFIEGIIVDITNRVVLEKTLLQREKLNTLGAIAAEVAHEIRNPLVCIGGFARRLQKRQPDSQEAGIILRQSERLEKILGRIRDYLRPVEVRPRECSLNEIVTECMDLLSPEIRAKGVNFRLDLDDNLPLVLTDHDILAEVCINLIRNALTATAPGAEAVIRTFETEQNLHVEIKNETSEATRKKAENLFLPFDQGGESIGLPLCYQLLKKMGCLLSFDEKDKHVTFTIVLPRNEEACPHTHRGVDIRSTV